MALIKLGELITALSGKIGGQSISNRGQKTTIRNIIQTNKEGTTSQSEQRERLTGVSNKWQFLTAVQRSQWLDESINYKYINRIGVENTRNAFQTFNYLNLNLKLINKPINLNAPPYIPVTIPHIKLVDVSTGIFKVKATNVTSVYLYAVFGIGWMSYGSQPWRGRSKFIGYLTHTQLLAGIDLVPMFHSVYNTLQYPRKLAVTIEPINQTTGNRQMDPEFIINEPLPMIIKIQHTAGIQVSLPTHFNNAYNALITWGDGTQSTGTSYTDINFKHTYATTGISTIYIDGIFQAFYVNNQPFKNNLLDILQFGSVELNAFSLYGCANIKDLNPIDKPIFIGTNPTYFLFRLCTTLETVKNIEDWDISMATSLQLAFQGTKFKSNLNKWNTSQIKSLASCFSTSTFDGDISAWNVSNVEDMSSFMSTKIYTKSLATWNISNKLTNLTMAFTNTLVTFSIANWDTSKVSSWNQTFRNTQYAQNLALNNFSSATDMTLVFLGNNTYSTANYNALLQKLVADGPKSNVTAGFQNCKYTLGSAGATARATLITTYGWIITDGGGI